MKELKKVYTPNEIEDKIYKFWLDNNFFNAFIDKSKSPYVIIMPPPNITGKLHMGHALDNTIQDIIIRYKRMDGFSALWLPGTDHAAIATELKIIQDMKSEGITKQDLGRDLFLKRAWDWKNKYGSSIVNQLKKLGSSCDWSRERFTMDEVSSKSVRQVFFNLYEKGYIYKGKNLINWCTSCLTSISDIEVNFEEKNGKLYHIKYKITDEDKYVTIATTRPETLLGDVAVAVNPNDNRYKDLIGKFLDLPLCNRKIPIISDDYVDIDFGTGVVKITPAHDINDYEVGKRHELEPINIMTEDGRINENGGIYQGLDRYEARKKIINDLDTINLLEKVDDRTHNVGQCYRCNTVIEPLISEQWFVKMKELAENANAKVKDGEISFIPSRFSKIYFHWMDNIKDWCISRQLWWGHRIPVFYCNDCSKITVTSDETIDKCSHCNSSNIYQDEDTLDTWFSSALWPFSTLGWPLKTEDFEYFYPTDTLVTAYDIIFFWVARMIFSAVEQTGQVPFKNVFIHGIVRDEDGKKMSKSLGNGIDPIEVIEEYGADALRFALILGNSPGNDMRLSNSKIISGRNFANKIWNAARFIMMNVDETSIPNIPDYLNLEDKWILTNLNNLILQVRDNLDKFELGLALSKIYDFSWNIFCDWYVEIVKSRLSSDENTKSLIMYIFNNILKLLHPFMPFLTEEIYKSLPNNQDSIMLSSFPVFDEKFVFTNDSETFSYIIDSIISIRNKRSELNVPVSRKVNIYIKTKNIDFFELNKDIYISLASAKDVFVGEDFIVNNAVECITSKASILLSLDDLVNKEEEAIRLDKKMKKVEKEIEFLRAKLDNKSFIDKAPKHLVEEHNKKLAMHLEKLENIKQGINYLNR